MITKKLSDTIKGWYIGNFEKAIYKTTEFESAVKFDKAGTYYEKHYHQVCAEIIAVISGHIRINGKDFFHGDIILIEPGEQADFEAVLDSVTAITKSSSIPKDKFYAL
ncbi:hypothetical protein KA977_04805 [Candidatus Dependentiae bacterium]|nr:hypothetical protein [Candidatus Dependentiae bacterium]